MNIAYAVALFTFTLNLAMALGHFAVSRAPGWRASRVFSFVALTACLYSLDNMIFTDPTLPDGFYLAAVRLSYVVAHLHMLAWYLLAFGGPDASFAALSRGMRNWLKLSVGIMGFFALTGLHLGSPLYELRVPWAHVVYHYVPTTTLGDLYEVVIS
jgi:hypothetical protein